MKTKIDETQTEPSQKVLANEFYKQIDWMVMNLAKSVLIDLELQKYSQ